MLSCKDETLHAGFRWFFGIFFLLFKAIAFENKNKKHNYDICYLFIHPCFDIFYMQPSISFEYFQFFKNIYPIYILNYNITLFFLYYIHLTFLLLRLKIILLYSYLVLFIYKNFLLFFKFSSLFSF